METGKEFNALLQVLAGEQQIIQRTDQKAFTLLSKDPDEYPDFCAYDGLFHRCNGHHLFSCPGHRSADPKVKTLDKDVEKDEVINPTFFAGISQFKSPEEYAFYLKSIAKDDEQLYQMFASQVFSLGNINLVKNENIRQSVFFFITALISELLIIMSMAYARALPFLFPNG